MAVEGSARRACERVVQRETQSELACDLCFVRCCVRYLSPLCPYDSEERQDLNPNCKIVMAKLNTSACPV